MDEKQIGIKIKTSLSGTSEARLTKYAENLSKIQAFSKGIDKGTLKQIDSSADGLKDNNKQLDQIEKNTRRAFSIQGITGFLRSAKTLVKTFSDMTKKSSEYTENLNLYQVAFDGATEQADKFINKLTEMYGLDESWLTRTVGTFKQLSNAMGLSVEQGTNLSTLMTQMAIDISSLYNTDVDRASTVLQSALAGQTRPIRSLTGADITQNTLQNTLDTMGIERAVSQLSFAEKRLLIIISLTQQLNQVTNDFGKTIESPANQTRILNEQWQRLTRAVGNLFLPILAKILPYLNAILMVLTEIINFVASLFGIEIDDFNYGVAGTSDAFLDMQDSIDGASESAKKLKSGLRGFDKLNVISTPSSGSSGGGAGGIDPKIQEAFNDAFKKYNEMLKEVNMKANKIRDAMLDWLGFTDGSYRNLKLIAGILGVIAGAKLFSFIEKLLAGKGLLGKLFSGKNGKNLKTNIAIFGKWLAIIGSAVAQAENLKYQFEKVTEEIKKGESALKAIYVPDGVLDFFSKLTAYSTIATGFGGLGLLGIDLAIIADWLGINIKKTEELSETTSKAFDGISKSLNDVTYDLMQLDISKGLKIDNKVITDVKKDLKVLTEGITKNVTSTKETMIKNINEMVSKGYISEEEKNKAIKKTNELYNGIEKTTNEAQNKINQILQTASNEKRALTDDERKEIEKNYQILKENTVSSLTTSAQEQKVIMQKIRDANGELSKQTASQIIKDAIKTRDEAIKKAEEQYDGTLLEAQKLLDIGAINQETYDKIALEAKNTKDSAIKNAEEQYDGVWTEFETSNKDIAKYIDEDTGGVKSNWTVFWDDIGTIVSEKWKKIEEKWGKYFTKEYWSKKWDKVKETFNEGLEKIKTSISNFKFPKIKLNVTYDTKVGSVKTAVYKALGLDGWPKLNFSTYAQGGLPPVGQLFVANEKGPELVGHIGGQSFVANQNQMMDLLDRKISSSGGMNNATFIIQVGSKEVARTVLTDLQDMAKSNGKPITIQG